MSNIVDINENVLEGKWKQIKGRVRQKWGKLTDDELEQVAGKRDELVGIIQEKYGRTRKEVEDEVTEFLRGL